MSGLPTSEAPATPTSLADWEAPNTLVHAMSVDSAQSFRALLGQVRASMLETMNADYVRTARAKGLSEGRTIFRHAFRNALMPLSTVVALDFGALIGGAIITESIFGWSGMGRFFTDALAAKEPDPILAFVMVTAVAVLVFNLIADLLYARLDPRVRLD